MGIKTFAETHGCEELRKAAEKYILKHFVDLVDSEEFLQLDNEDVVSLIKCDNLTVSKLYLKNRKEVQSLTTTQERIPPHTHPLDYLVCFANTYPLDSDYHLNN